MNHQKRLPFLAYRSLFVVAFLGWAIAILPRAAWEYLGIWESWQAVRLAAFLVALISSVSALGGALFDLTRTLMTRRRKGLPARRLKHAHDRLIQGLPRVKKEILAAFVEENTTMLEFDLRDGIVNGLIAQGILYRGSPSSCPRSRDVNVYLHSWVCRYLKEHPEVLEDVSAVQRPLRYVP